jgi:hypothetical protein
VEVESEECSGSHLRISWVEEKATTALQLKTDPSIQMLGATFATGMACEPSPTTTPNTWLAQSSWLVVHLVPWPSDSDRLFLPMLAHGLVDRGSLIRGTGRTGGSNALVQRERSINERHPPTDQGQWSACV